MWLMLSAVCLIVCTNYKGLWEDFIKEPVHIIGLLGLFSIVFWVINRKEE